MFKSSLTYRQLTTSTILNISKITTKFKTIYTARKRHKIAKLIQYLDQKGYTIITNNCLSGLLYSISFVPYRSPTVGLYFIGSSYAYFLNDYLSNTLSLKNISVKTLEYYNDRLILKTSHDGMIVFLHYATAEAAVAAWNRRYERMIERKPLIILSVRDNIDENGFSQIVRKWLQNTLVLKSGRSEVPPADVLMINKSYLHRIEKFLLCQY